MSEYTESVERGLQGLTAVSTGVCPGCDTCREAHQFVPEEIDPEPGEKPWVVPDDVRDEDGRWPRYGTGPKRARPDQYYDTEEQATEAAREAFDEACSSGGVCDEGSFSWSGCGICGSNLGGTVYDWHAVNDDDELLHFNDACTDCVLYLANGDEPDA